MILLQIKLEILKIMSELDPDTQLVVFPELALSGYTCQDLFLEDVLLRNVRIELEDLVSKMPQNLLAIVGLPLVIENRLYNCAAFIRKNEVLAIQAKLISPLIMNSMKQDGFQVVENFLKMQL